MEVRKGALAGLRVLDMTQFFAGPYCGMYFADMGAEVIKIERPKVGDSTRQSCPIRGTVSGYYSNLNRGKYSLCLDLKSEEGKKILQKLIKTADILIENNRPGVMDRLGFGFNDVHKMNPELIYASISGFGQTGPYAAWPGYDLIA